MGWPTHRCRPWAQNSRTPRVAFIRRDISDSLSQATPGPKSHGHCAWGLSSPHPLTHCTPFGGAKSSLPCSPRCAVAVAGAFPTPLYFPCMSVGVDIRLSIPGCTTYARVQA
jgi:hypothetical protein